MELVSAPLTNLHPNRHAEFISAALTNTIHEPTNPKVLHWIELSPWAKRVWYDDLDKGGWDGVFEQIDNVLKACEVP